MAANRETPLLIIGAGPFGLALASYATSHGISCLVVGEPMEFWTQHMPKGMLLRSTCDWHLDTDNIHTIDAWLAETGQTCAQVEPLSLELYLRYAQWFQTQKRIDPLRATVRRLDREDVAFKATLEDGSVVRAHNVVIAAGLRYFAHSPAEITSLLPADSFAHTCECVDLEKLAGRRYLIIGGRQSAFEWAALLHEAQAAAVHVCYRHDTPAFAESDWSWVAPLVDRIPHEGGWYRRLPEPEKQAIVKRMWAEGRGKLEPWLEARIDHDSVQLWPRTRLRSCTRTNAGDLRVTLDGGHVIVVDQIILATGYKVDIERIPFLDQSNLWSGLSVRDGNPELDDWLQTSHSGLFFTGQAAVQDYGPFFGFTVAARASAERIGQAVLRQ
jgi:cation diffusion facilitator CzcD-associated flavoprotein CzcO